MKVSFRTRQLEKLATNEKIRLRKLGPRCAKLFERRISELIAATCLEDLRNLPGPRIHELKADRKDQFSVDLLHPDRLILISINNPPPRNKTGGWDWSQITEIEILEIADTHD